MVDGDSSVVAGDYCQVEFALGGRLSLVPKCCQCEYLQIKLSHFL